MGKKSLTLDNKAASQTLCDVGNQLAVVQQLFQHPGECITDEARLGADFIIEDIKSEVRSISNLLEERI